MVLTVPVRWLCGRGALKGVDIFTKQLREATEKAWVAQVSVDDRGVLVNVVNISHSRRVVSVRDWVFDTE